MQRRQAAVSSTTPSAAAGRIAAVSAATSAAILATPPPPGGATTAATDPRVAVSRHPAHLSGSTQVSLLRRHAGTIVTLLLMFLVFMTLIDVGPAPANDGKGRLRFYGRWPGLSASNTARILSKISKAIDPDAGASVFEAPSATPRAPAFVAGSDKSWAAVCSHRATLDDSTVGGNAAVAAAVAGDDGTRGRPIHQSILDLATQYHIICADLDIFLTGDGVVFVGHPGIAATALLGDGTNVYTSESGTTLLNNMTADDLKRLDPSGALVTPLALVAQSIRSVAVPYLSPSATAAQAPQLPRMPGSSGTASPLLFSLEPKASLVDPGARAALIAAIGDEEACSDARRFAASDPAKLSHSTLERCKPLLVALRRGPLALLLRKAAPVLAAAGVGVPFAVEPQRAANDEERSSQWSPVRFIADVDSVVFEVLCLLAHSACAAAHAPGSIGNNPIDVYFAVTPPVERWSSSVAAWIVTILLRSIVMVGSGGRLMDDAAAAIAKDIAGMVPAAFIVPLKDRWLIHRAALAARGAKHSFYATSGNHGGSSPVTTRLATTPTPDNTTAARLQELVNAAVHRARALECSVLQAYSHHYIDESGLGEKLPGSGGHDPTSMGDSTTAAPALTKATAAAEQPDVGKDGSPSVSTVAVGGSEQRIPTTPPSRGDAPVDGGSATTAQPSTAAAVVALQTTAPQAHRSLALPPWVAHVMPSLQYLRICFANDPTVMSRTRIVKPAAQPAVGATSDAAPGGPAAAGTPTQLPDPRTFHCWVADSVAEADEAVGKLHCSHLVSNKPVALGAAAFGFAPAPTRPSAPTGTPTAATDGAAAVVAGVGPRPAA